MLLVLLSRFSRVWLCVTYRPEPTRLICPWESPGKNSGVGCHAFTPPGDLPNPGLERTALLSPVLSGPGGGSEGFLTTSTTWEDPLRMLTLIKNHDLSINSVLVLDLSIRFSDLLYTCSVNFLSDLSLSILSFSTSVNWRAFYFHF